METQEQGKAVAKRAKPEIVKIGDQQRISTGRWNDDLVADYVIANGDRWIPVGELTKFAYGNGSPRMKERARQCLSKVFRVLLFDRGAVMISQIAERRRVVAVKIYDGSDEADREAMRRKLGSLRDRNQLTGAQYQAALERFESIMMKPEEEPAE